MNPSLPKPPCAGGRGHLCPFSLWRCPFVSAAILYSASTGHFHSQPLSRERAKKLLSFILQDWWKRKQMPEDLLPRPTALIENKKSRRKGLHCPACHTLNCENGVLTGLLIPIQADLKVHLLLNKSIWSVSINSAEGMQGRDSPRTDGEHKTGLRSKVHTSWESVMVMSPPDLSTEIC